MRGQAYGTIGSFISYGIQKNSWGNFFEQHYGWKVKRG